MSLLDPVYMNSVYAAVWLIVTATLLGHLLGVPLPTGWRRTVAAGGIGFFMVASIATTLARPTADDFISFWELGGVLIAGGDSLSFIAQRSHPPLNAPTAYPLFAAFALLPLRAGLIVWVCVSAAATIMLVPLCYRTLADRAVPGTTKPPPGEVLLVIAAVAVSNAPRSMVQAGQLGIASAIALAAALVAQSRGCPGWAGFWLIPGTIKPNTALPFLLLFLRRRDLKTWIVAAVAGMAVVLAVGWGTDPVRHVRVYLQTIEKHAGPGEVNDLTFGGSLSAGMVGLDYAFYRLGFRAAGAASRAQLVALLAIGAALALRLFRRGGGLPTGGDCALIALYSTIFLYHRTADLIILALPLTYAVVRARSESGKARRAYLVAATAILLALSMQRKAIELVEAAIRDRVDALALIAQGLVLPYATWLVVAAMLAVALGDRWMTTLPAEHGSNRAIG